MQGFNMGRYIPPHLEGTHTFNAASRTTPKSLQRNPDGSQTVRFECPFPIWCTNCTPETIIAQGVRFNAHKKKVGMYFSTAVWSFRIKHTVCGGWIEVRTDPRNTEYVVTEGGRRRDLGADRGEDGEVVLPDIGVGGIEGVLGKLEKRKEGETLAEKEKVRVEELKRRSERDWGDPYEVNRRLRKVFRVGRRVRQDDERTGEGLKDRFGLGLDVVAPTKEDGERAKLIDFGGRDDGGGVARGLFEGSVSAAEKSAGKDGDKRGKKIDLAAQKKATLRNDLRGNTRARMDPFWKDDAWSIPVKRRRGDETATDTRDDEVTTTTNTNTKATLVAYDSD